MNILITGVNGLIGNNLVKTLSNDPQFHVFGIDISSARMEHARYKHLNINLTDPDSFFHTLNVKADVVVHLAQSRFYKEFPVKNMDVFEVNVHSTLRLLEWARTSGVRQFIYASSGGIYGFGKNVFSEEYSVKLNSNLGFYLSTKLMGETLVHNYSSFFKTTIIRPFFVFGPNQNPNMLIPSLIRRIRSNEPVVLKGESGIRINPIHVEDASGIIKLLIQNEAEGVFNVCGDEIVTLKQITEIIGKKINVVPQYNVQPSEGNDDIIGDNQKIKSLGYSYGKKIFDEIEHMCNFF